MMKPSRTALTIFAAIICIPRASPCQDVVIPQYLNVKEDDLPGYILHQGEVSSGTLDILEISGSVVPLGQYLKIQQNSTGFSVEVNQTLDLEYFRDEYGLQPGSQLQIKIECTGGSPTREFTLWIIVAEVNEFHPEFIGAPFNTSVSEDTAVGTTVFTLKDKAFDNDFDSSVVNNIYKFAISRYIDNKVDGIHIFAMPDAQHGGIIVPGSLDYDSLTQQGTTYYILNVTAQDYDNLLTWTTLKINILDSDDLGPAFTLDGCFNEHTEKCQGYSVEVSPSFKGLLDIMPSQPQARDLDTIGSTIVYSIDLVTPASHRDYFTIDPANAHLTLIKEITDITDIYLIIEATEDNMPNRNATKAIIAVSVDNNNPGQGTQKSSSISMTIFGIVMGCLIAVLIVVSIVAIVCVRKHKKESVHPAENSTDDSLKDVNATTGSSSVGSVSSGVKLINNGQVVDYLNMPTNQKGNMLPAIESKINKKKKSKKRKKEEAEIYDGTKTYPGVADDEFYQTPDKTKIKRTERSYDREELTPRVMVANETKEHNIYNTIDTR